MTRLAEAGLSRRTLLRVGGAAALGAMIAACGDRETSDAPGRVGAAPPATDRPTSEVDDVALLRTAQSLEYTIIDVYARFDAEGIVDDAFATPFGQFVADHRAHAATLGGLITAAGGDEFACTNPWIVNRAVEPIMTSILVGDEAQDVPPSDNPRRDAASVAFAFENLAGSSYQALVGGLREPMLRSEAMLIAVQEVRHASVIALVRTGAPKAYVSTVVLGEETADDEEGMMPPYVLTSRFGSMSANTLTVGAPNAAGTRFSATLETPAENSIIYKPMTCEESSS